MDSNSRAQNFPSGTQNIYLWSIYHHFLSARSLDYSKIFQQFEKLNGLEFTVDKFCSRNLIVRHNNVLEKRSRQKIRGGLFWNVYKPVNKPSFGPSSEKRKYCDHFFFFKRMKKQIKLNLFICIYLLISGPIIMDYNSIFLNVRKEKKFRKQKSKKVI